MRRVPRPSLLSSEDLYLAALKLKGEDCWVVAHSKTFDGSKQQLSMKVPGFGRLPPSPSPCFPALCPLCPL